MPRPCTICEHPQKDAIDADLLTGGGYRSKARRFAVSEHALLRHKRDHLAIRMVPTSHTEIAQADDLVAQVLSLQGKVEGILASAEQAGKPVVALQAVRELRELIKLQGNLLGQLWQPQNIHIDQLVIHQEWQQLQMVIVAALAPFPEARDAVQQALLEVHDGTA